MTPEYAVVHAAHQLTATLKEKSKIAMDESGIDQINKLDAIFNTTVKKFRKRKEKQHP